MPAKDIVLGGEGALGRVIEVPGGGSFKINVDGFSLEGKAVGDRADIGIAFSQNTRLGFSIGGATEYIRMAGQVNAVLGEPGKVTAQLVADGRSLGEVRFVGDPLAKEKIVALPDSSTDCVMAVDNADTLARLQVMVENEATVLGESNRLVVLGATEVARNVLVRGAYENPYIARQAALIAYLDNDGSSLRRIRVELVTIGEDGIPRSHAWGPIRNGDGQLVHGRQLGVVDRDSLASGGSGNGEGGIFVAEKLSQEVTGYLQLAMSGVEPETGRQCVDVDLFRSIRLQDISEAIFLFRHGQDRQTQPLWETVSLQQRLEAAGYSITGILGAAYEVLEVARLGDAYPGGYGFWENFDGVHANHATRCALERALFLTQHHTQAGALWGAISSGESIQGVNDYLQRIGEPVQVLQYGTPRRVGLSKLPAKAVGELPFVQEMEGDMLHATPLVLGQPDRWDTDDPNRTIVTGVILVRRTRRVPRSDGGEDELTVFQLTNSLFDERVSNVGGLDKAIKLATKAIGRKFFQEADQASGNPIARWLKRGE